jgi:hypothetical protein
MNKLDALKKLRELVVKEGTIRCKYRDLPENGNACYCVIGHLARVGGADEGLFDSLEDWENTQSLVYMEPNEFYNYLSNTGLTEFEMIELQKINDDVDEEYSTNSEREVVLLRELDRLIADEEELQNARK